MTTTSTKATQAVADEQATQSVAAGPTPKQPLQQERQGKIAEHAYHLALARGFAPGHELDDWLAAERALEEGAVAQAA